MAVSQNISFFVSGYNLATALQSYGVSLQLDELDASVLANSYREYEAGYSDATIKASGIFRSDTVNADEIHDILSAAMTGRSTFNFAASFGTITVGDPAILANACETKYEVDVPIGRLIMVASDIRSKTGLDFGKWLMNSQLNAGTNNGTGVNNGAATANGGFIVGHLANNGATSVALQLQHSTDGSTWADVSGALITLTGTYDSDSYTIPAGTTVNAHTRIVATVAGGNTTLVSVAFARR